MVGDFGEENEGDFEGILLQLQRSLCHWNAAQFPPAEALGKEEAEIAE